MLEMAQSGYFSLFFEVSNGRKRHRQVSDAEYVTPTLFLAG